MRIYSSPSRLCNGIETIGGWDILAAAAWLLGRSTIVRMFSLPEASRWSSHVLAARNGVAIPGIARSGTTKEMNGSGVDWSSTLPCCMSPHSALLCRSLSSSLFLPLRGPAGEDGARAAHFHVALHVIALCSALLIRPFSFRPSFLTCRSNASKTAIDSLHALPHASIPCCVA